MKVLFGTVLLGFFVMHSDDKPLSSEVRVVTLIETSKAWTGEDLPHYPEGKPQIKVLKISIPPRTKLKTHLHPVINAGVMLKGELVVSLETGKKLKIKEGEAIVEVVDTWHYGENQTDEVAEILVFYAGVEGKPITVIKEN